MKTFSRLSPNENTPTIAFEATLGLIRKENSPPLTRRPVDMLTCPFLPIEADSEEDLTSAGVVALFLGAFNDKYRSSALMVAQVLGRTSWMPNLWLEIVAQVYESQTDSHSAI
ncbi:hypothetical protein TNCV_470481 [Trichonephila clavipes]|nr:hypothetical protein TNCV_470481 [Trichonephila clavipes]